MPSTTQITMTCGLLLLMGAHHTHDFLNIHLSYVTLIALEMLSMDANYANSENMKTSSWPATRDYRSRCLRRRFMER
jgi:hypothetical protein